MNKTILVFKNIIYAIKSLFWKRDDGIVLFGSWFGDKFADNPKYLYLHLSEHKDEYHLQHVVWVTRNSGVYDVVSSMGYEVYMMESEESIYYHKHAKYHIVCNAPADVDGRKGEILGQYSFGAKKINLWHGVAGVKGVNLNSNEYREKVARHPVLYSIKNALYRNSNLLRKFFVCPGGWGDCYYLSTSEAETNKLMGYFALPRNHYIESNYPRVCKCERLTEEETDILELMKEYKSVFLYLPTFRTSESKFDFKKTVDILGDWLEENSVLWIQKSHTAQEVRLKRELRRNVLELDTNFDINVLLPYVSLVVTDYSSVMSDAAYYNKPVLLYVPDYQEYMHSNRGLVKEAEEIMDGFGYKIYTGEDLLHQLDLHKEKLDFFKSSKYENVRKKYWSNNCEMEDIWLKICSAVG